MKTYIIAKAREPITESSWNAAHTAQVTHSPWQEYANPYQTEARLIYTDEAIYVHLKTDEKPLTALHTERDSSVCKDSCMEFFFSPDSSDTRYFNFEINPLGTLLLYLCADRYNTKPVAVDEKIFEIKSVITQSHWELFYKVPITFILTHFEKITDEIRGNFYKCGDESFRKHYACWNEIDLPAPDFHRPEFFGKLIFEKGAPKN